MTFVVKKRKCYKHYRFLLLNRDIYILKKAQLLWENVFESQSKKMAFQTKSVRNTVSYIMEKKKLVGVSEGGGKEIFKIEDRSKTVKTFEQEYYIRKY